MIRRLAAALALALALLSPAWAHDPVLIDATVAAEGDSVSVTIEVRQAVLLAGIAEVRSRFDSRADYQRLEPRIALWVLKGVALDIDGAEASLGYEGPTATGELADPVAVRLSTKLPVGAQRVALTLTLLKNLDGAMSIIDNIHLAGHDDQAATVKPGEAVTLRLDPPRAGGSGVGSFLSFVRLGFLHIVPEGLDHILFVLGLFLLSPKLKPVLTQVTAFTVAHSLTLGLSLAGVVTLPSRVVEPLIAASIAVVAIENVVTRELRPWRWMVVFGFGLIHGLGFAGALKGLHLPTTGILKPLLGFNLGVELGQLTVIAGAAALTWWTWRRPWYRRAIVVPASLAIAGVGLFWAIQRGLGYGIEP